MNSEAEAFTGTLKVPLDVPSLTESADVVCKGEVAYVYDEGEVQHPAGDPSMSLTKAFAVFHVDRIYKGAIANAIIEIEFLQPDFPTSLEGLKRGEYVLVFLKPKKDHYQFVNPTTSKMPIEREPPPAIQGKEAPLTRIRKELIRSLGAADPSIVLSAIEQLGKLKSKESVAALRLLIASENPQIREAAIAALLNLGDLTQIEAATTFIKAAAEAPETETAGHLIADAISRLKQPELIDSIAPLLESTSAQLRYAAVRAMRNMRAESTIPFLIKALDDADLNVRYQAVMALAEVTRQPEWEAAIDEFQRDEARYISHWKKWRAKEEQK